MPVLDEIIFGPDSQLGIIMTYGDVRSLDGEGKLRALKRRLDAFLIAQVDALGKAEDGTAKVYSPFPLALLTCVGIETLGQVMYHDDRRGKEDAQKEGFLKVAKSLHKNFSRALKKDEKQAIKGLFPAKNSEKVETVAQILYLYQRNTLIHGDQSRGVYLTEDLAEWELREGALRLNPYWLWRNFKAKYEELFLHLFSNVEPTNSLRKSALAYLSKILT
jgi:hypothetical protein